MIAHSKSENQIKKQLKLKLAISLQYSKDESLISLVYRNEKR